MHVLVSSFNSNPNVGLYGIVTDKYVLLGKETPTHHDKEISEVFGLPIERINIAGTSLLGVFCLWHKGKLYVPSITFDHEQKTLEKLGVDYSLIQTDLTCLGNNILVTEKGALLNPEFSEEEEHYLSKELGVPCRRTTLAETEAIGSIGVFAEKNGLFHRDLKPNEVKELETFLGLTITTGTVNMGNPYIKSGVLISAKGFVIGDASGGPEIANADEALGFLGKEE